jgi:CYTH domain-containing protein
MSAINIALLDAGPQELAELGEALRAKFPEQQIELLAAGPPAAITERRTATVTLSSGRSSGPELADHSALSDYHQVYASNSISGDEIAPWLGHPELKIVPDFQPETVSDKLLAAITGDGGPEIERKFLLNPAGQIVDWGTVLSAERPSCQVIISQCYLSPPEAEQEVRLRAWHLPTASFYFQTTKSSLPGSGGRERREIEVPLTVDQYQRRKAAAADAPEINKRRIIFWDCGQKWELDQIGARWFLELELYSAQQQISWPPEINSWTEVTGQQRWKNRSLAR